MPITYPVTFVMDFIEGRSRLTTFLRWLLAIPHFLFATVYTIAFYVVYIVAWFALRSPHSGLSASMASPPATCATSRA